MSTPYSKYRCTPYPLYEEPLDMIYVMMIVVQMMMMMMMTYGSDDNDDDDYGGR